MGKIRILPMHCSFVRICSCAAGKQHASGRRQNERTNEQNERTNEIDNLDLSAISRYVAHTHTHMHMHMDTTFVLYVLSFSHAN
jgi:hypothetical protein